MRKEKCRGGSGIYANDCCIFTTAQRNFFLFSYTLFQSGVLPNHPGQSLSTSILFFAHRNFYEVTDPFRGRIIAPPYVKYTVVTYY